MGELVGTTKAVEVIRRFKIPREQDPYEELCTLQENVIRSLSELGSGEGFEVTFSEIESLKMVTTGLHDALTEVQQQWREELTAVLVLMSGLSRKLKELTRTL